METLKEDKLCVCCGKQFRGDISFCPDDDDQLVSLNENPFEGTQFEREFQILSVLGWGGWGMVYRAHNILMERNVAIKMLHSRLAANQQRQRRFKREAIVLADLNHPNIASVFKYNTLPDGRPFVVMEFMAGKTLEEILADRRTLSVEDAVSVFIDTCDALAFAHAKGVVHRDIKPSNLMLTKDHRGQTTVKVLDFGLAKIFWLDDATNLTRTGETIGTPNYMSPEQCRGLTLDQRSDVYSLGCVMYETLTGLKSVTGTSFYECMQRHISGDVIPPSVAARGGNVCADLEQIIMKAMAKNPDNRYQSATRLKSDLQCFAGTLAEVHGTSGGKVGQRRRSSDGSAGQHQKGVSARLQWFAAVALLSVCGVSALLLLQNHQRGAINQASVTELSAHNGPGTPASVPWAASFSTSIEALNQAASEYSGYPHTVSACYIRIGDIYMKKGDKGQAVYNYHRALKVRTEDTYSALARARIQRAQHW